MRRRFRNFEKPFSTNWFKSYAFILIGTVLMSAGYVYFINPHQIVPGGVYGITIILHHKFGLPLGLTALAFNIPLTIAGYRVLGPRFGIKTVIGFVLAAVLIEVLNYYSEGKPLVEDDVLLSCVFGGLLIGAGVGLMFKAKASVGGSDVLTLILGKLTKMPYGQLVMIIDSSIVLLGLLVFQDWKIPLYSWVVIFILSKVMDTILQGWSHDKTLFIVSEKHEDIKEKIIYGLNRGGTLLNGQGMYKGVDKKVIFTVVNRRELAILEEYISQIDPDAFMSVVEANEILGKGFKSIKEKVS